MTKKKIKTKEEGSVFEKTIENFTLNVDSMSFSLPVAMNPLVKEYEHAKKSFNDFFIGRRKGKGGTYKILFPEISHFDDLENKLTSSRLAIRTVPRSLFISLISYFDNYLREIIKIIYLKNPTLLSGTEKKISVSEILEIENFEEAKSFLTHREIEQLLYEGRFKCFDWIEEKIKSKLDISEPLKKKFIEITERRNLFVHSDGVVTQQYLNTCKRNKINLDKKIKIGSQLTLTPGYFYSSCSVVLAVGVQLGQVVWRALDKDKLKDADVSLLNLSAALIEKNNNYAAGRLLDFASNLKDSSSEELKLMLMINRALAMKFGGCEKDAIKLIGTHDWSADNNDLKLGVAIIKNDMKNAVKIMFELGPTQEMKMAYKKHWPLFKEFKKTALFRKTYKKIFNEPFTLEEHKLKN